MRRTGDGRFPQSTRETPEQGKCAQKRRGNPKIQNPPAPGVTREGPGHGGFPRVDPGEDGKKTDDNTAALPDPSPERDHYGDTAPWSLGHAEPIAAADSLALLANLKADEGKTPWRHATAGLPLVVPPTRPSSTGERCTCRSPRRTASAAPQPRDRRQHSTWSDRELRVLRTVPYNRPGHVPGADSLDVLEIIPNDGQRSNLCSVESARDKVCGR
jgi:hypothetical protein